MFCLRRYNFRTYKRQQSGVDGPALTERYQVSGALNAANKICSNGNQLRWALQEIPTTKSVMQAPNGNNSEFRERSHD